MENDKSAGKSAGPQSAGRQTRWSARQLAIMAIFIALGALFGFIPIPIFPPAASFGITYDPANVPAMLGGFAYGAGAGSIIGILSAVVHGLLVGDIVGTCMNIVAVVGFVVPAALICRKSRSNVRLIVALVVGSLVSVALIIPANLIVWPNFYGIPFDVTLTFVVPLMLPFNLLKVLLNSILSFILYKSLHKLLER
ncbi:MAG: ECF transporter S component [Coriobacteriia bacterium]|nr:ECF transporter S component [Coriobacteriia bacterium]